MNDTTSLTGDATTVDPDLLAMIRDVLDDDLTDRLDQATTGISLDKAKWQQLTELGLTALTTPEDAGGSGAGWLESAALLSTSAAFARHLPVAETDLLANWLLCSAGAPPDDPTMPRTVAVLDADGRASAVPWLIGGVRAVVAAHQPDGSLVLSDVDYGELAEVATISPVATNSGQPRAGLAIQDTTSLPVTGRVAPAQVEAVTNRLRLRGALARAIQCVGALDKAVDLCVEHTSVRMQFGRPLAAFQAVQRLVADAAAEAALARASVDAAVLHALAGDLSDEDSMLRIAVARSCAGHAASVVVRNSHQAHGAIGTTQEHPLQLFTLPPLDWRSEFGTTRSWDRVLGDSVRDTPSGLWSIVVGEARR